MPITADHSRDLADTTPAGHIWSFMSVAKLASAPTPDYLHALQPRHGKIVGTLVSVWNEFKGWCRQ